MFMKKTCTLLVYLMLIFGLLMQSGCQPKKSNSQNMTNKKITIGFSMDTLKEERWYIDKIDFVNEAKKHNANVIVDVAYEDSNMQISQVKDMIAKGINVLVIIPHDAKSAASAVKYAKENGVKVICYDRLVLNANSDLYISFDNEKVGELQAKALLKVVSKGNYVIIKGPSSDYNTVMISRGIMKVLNPYIQSGKINIIEQTNATDWMADEAYACIVKLINENKRINAVIAENDGLAGGTIDALSESKLIPSVPVVGMDADLAACQRVVEGQQLMTVYKPINQLAVSAVDFAVKIAMNKKIDVTNKINVGQYNVPYIKVEPIAVDRSNMNSTVVKDGFHTASEVYLNIPKTERSVIKQ